MRIKKYTATTMKEALMRIKQELGEDAMILKTRKIPRKMFTVGSQDEVEVTAAIDDGAAPASAEPALKPLAMSGKGVYARPRPMPVDNSGTAKVTPAMPAYAAAPKPAASPVQQSAAKPAIQTPMDRLKLLEIKDDIREIKDFLKGITQAGEAPAVGEFAGSWAALFKRLVSAEITPAIAEKIVRDVKGNGSIPDAEIEQRFFKILCDQVTVSGPIRLREKKPLKVAFVGPTGAGKTTTLAKLAAHYVLTKNSAVTIVTADTYRIAAIEQIRAFADIVNINLQVVFSPEDIAATLEDASQSDVVFVDTAGRSQRNLEHMQEIEAYMKALEPHETHLVLSSATKESDLEYTIRQYTRIGVNRLIFTKLDETLRIGNVFNVVRSSGIPISYLTNGQSVPDDIELAQPGRFIQRLWEGSVQ